tara:strand:+ start:137 stop:274 length:138 start_codon:yes stop_codon:yes gene_type:complete
MKNFTQWHKDRIECAANYFDLSNYQLLWLAAAKGIVFGYIVGKYI